MKRDLYFKELAVVLGRAGFTPLPQENDFLPVEYHGQRLCRVNAQGNVFYRQEEVDSPEREQARVKVTDMAGTVLEYMRHLEHDVLAARCSVYCGPVPCQCAGCQPRHH